MAHIRETNIGIFLVVLVYLDVVPLSSTINPLLREDDPRPLCPCTSTDRRLLTTRVVGGHNADKGQFPFAAALMPNYSAIFRILNPQEYPVKPYCGATLITDRHVVTAAHCLRERRADEIKVDVNDFNLTGHREDELKYRQATKLQKHPEYVKRTFNNDIGIIEFKNPIQFRDGDKTVWLPSSMSNLTTGTTVTVYGWGRLEYHGGNPDVLQTLDMPIVDKDICQEVFDHSITSNMICAGGKEHKDACIGDSGSGLTIRMDNEYTLVGVVSFGKKCGLKYVPGIYTKVSNYVDWIYDQTKTASCQPCIASPDGST